LAFGITPEAERRKVFDYLVGRITEGGSAQLGTGLIGGQWLMRTLTAYGRADLARELATREEYPGWGYMMSQGATTIWELWNGNTADPLMNSGNHVMLLGDLISWLFEDVAGIQPAEPGFSTIRFRPHFLFRSVTCHHHTMHGLASSSWDSTARNVSWEVVVPANVTAIAELPLGASTHLRVDGQAPPASNGGSHIRIPLEPGRHTLTFDNAGVRAVD
jgi:alpha-L-rhamnosidase